MAKYLSRLDRQIFETEEEAREDCARHIDWEHIATADSCDQLSFTIVLLKELRRLDNPLFWKFYEIAHDYWFRQWYYKFNGKHPEYAPDAIEWDDVANTVEEKEISTATLLKELQRLNSPLFWAIYEATYEGCFDETYYLTGEEKEKNEN